MSPVEPGTYTVSDLLHAYEREYLPTKAPKTQYQQAKLYRWIAADLGHLLLEQLTPAKLRAWRDELSRYYAPSTVRRYLDSLSGPLTVAVRDYEWLPANPLEKVQKPKAPPARVRFLSDEERTTLLLWCAQSRNPHLYLIVLLALTTGARKNELLWLAWQDVDLERGFLRLAQTKNRTRRAVPVRGKALQLLQERRGQHRPVSWVFPRFDQQKPVDIKAAWENAVKRAALHDFRFHDLRHTAASYLAMSGATLLEIAAILGHKSMQVTYRYAHLAAAHTGNVVERMTEKFLS
jgi:integrase